MCGIAGFAGFNDGELLRSMTRTLTYRGPDDEGFYEAPGVGLGHRRLSIIDLESGSQPMSSDDGTAVIVFNGEIYNYIEIRAELESRGIRFKTRSDTEVIVNLYRLDGETSFERLNGIFAFAVWDSLKKRLVLSRDHLGVKPVLYLSRDGVLVFASEAKAILQWSEYIPSVSLEALRENLAFSYVGCDETLFAGIRKLPPGSTLVWENGRATITQYWSTSGGDISSASSTEHRAEVRRLLEQSVRAQLVSDVPVGATLSGGLDSSAIVALMSQVSARPVKTFSLGFGNDNDELPFARIVAERFKTDHTEFVVDPSRFTELLPRVLWHLEEPLLSSILPTWYLGEAARKLVKVILIGEGADEVFAGYRRYRAFSGSIARIAPKRLKNWFYFWHFSSLGASSADTIYSAATRNELSRMTDPVNDRFERVVRGGKNRLNALLRYEQRYELADFQLLRIDRLTMAHSVEARVPFLDPRLVTYANSIPSKYKLRGATEKYILREAMRDLLPTEILGRKKRGLGTPLIPWFQGGMFDVARELLSTANIRGRGYFDAQAVDKLFVTARSHKIHREDLGKLFKLVMFELWCRIFLDGDRGKFVEPAWPGARATS